MVQHSWLHGLTFERPGPRGTFSKTSGSSDFILPSVLHHFETGSRYFLVVSRIPSQLLDEAWPNLDEQMCESYIGKVADICNHLAAWKGDTISGVDGHQPFERRLIKCNSITADAPEELY